MSLLGSLEDLGLGDILQIIHLSQKSGVLSIRGESGEGRIVFHEGLVRLASLKGGPDDLRGLLVDRGFVSQEAFELAATSALDSGDPLPVVLERQNEIDLGRIETLRRECVENAVGTMFGWASGEFSFDVGAEDELLASEVALSSGVNPQYLAMESLRLRDERRRSGQGVPPQSAGVPPGGESEPLGCELIAEATHDTFDDSAPVVGALIEMAGSPVDETGSVDDDLEPLLETVAVEEGSSRLAASAPPVVVIHESLAVLDWVRASLTPAFASVHIFQRSQEGLGRIRQYLARARAPMLLVDPAIEGSPLSGIRDAADFVRRLREQSSRMPILWLRSEHVPAETPLPLELHAVTHPAETALTAGESRPDLASRLCEGVLAELEGGAASALPGADPAVSDDLERLKLATETLSQTSSRGEILPLVLRFASENFSRVAIWMVRGEEVLGMAQAGIEAGGGPDDAEMRALRFRREDSARFSRVIERARPVRAAAEGAGDERLSALLGAAPGVSAYLAPIVSSDQVVALLYADNGSAPLAGDTSALEVVLHHAGLALDRAALERALVEPDA